MQGGVVFGGLCNDKTRLLTFGLDPNQFWFTKPFLGWARRFTFGLPNQIWFGISTSNQIWFAPNQIWFVKPKLVCKPNLV